MAKDAQGHGSDGRGGVRRNLIKDELRNAKTAERIAGVTDATAAAALSSGGPKSAQVPVHDSMGRPTRTSRAGWEVEHDGHRSYHGSRAAAVEYRQAVLDKGHRNVSITDPRGNLTHG
jgi:hypothetical protein